MVRRRHGRDKLSNDNGTKDESSSLLLYRTEVRHRALLYWYRRIGAKGLQGCARKPL